MKIQEFVKNYNNHPIMFIGTGLSLRYLANSFSWDDLLSKIAFDLKGNNEYYLDLKAKYGNKNNFDFPKIAQNLEKDFNKITTSNRSGKFKFINDLFYKKMENSINVSRFKLYIAFLLKNITYKKNIRSELTEFKKAGKNIGSIITTNYDRMLEDIFSFTPLIGNNILLSNPYGSIYKIHGCITSPEDLIITDKDYEKFNKKYELIRAQLLSLFIHNPIVFLGYNIGDRNIKDILNTIFSYVDKDSAEAKLIRDNFLLVEYEEGSHNTNVVEHDIDIDGQSLIKINKLKTDDFKSLYKSISELTLKVSVMDIRKVKNIVKDISTGGEIKVKIEDDLDSLNNADKLLYIGSKSKIEYVYYTVLNIIMDYFEIIEKSDYQKLQLLNKLKIQSNQYFPIFGFLKIYNDIKNADKLKIQQKEKIESLINNIPLKCKKIYTAPEEIINDSTIPQSKKINMIISAIIKKQISQSIAKDYLIKYPEKSSTDYKKILCAYDLVCYSDFY